MIMIIINIVQLQQNQSRIEVVRWNSREGETKEVFAEIKAQSMYQLVSIGCLMTCLFLVRILNHMECSWRGPSWAVGKGDAAPALSWFPPAVRTTKPYSILSTYPPSPPYPPLNPPCGGVLWMQKIQVPFYWEPRAIRYSLIKAWSISECSFVYFAYCQEVFLFFFAFALHSTSLSSQSSSSIKRSVYWSVHQTFICDLLTSASSW